MHWIQESLLELSKSTNIDKLRHAQLVDLVGCKHQSQIAHHLKQLINRGYLVKNSSGSLVPSMSESSGMIKIPVMGEADCGEATRYADGRVTDTLVVSPSLIRHGKSTDRLYALVARGDSMNRAIVEGKPIEDGDYVIVEKNDSYQPSNKDIVVSIIGGLANVKRYLLDDENRRIVLAPDSYRQSDFAPIFVSSDDEFQIEGRVIDVIKGVKS